MKKKDPLIYPHSSIKQALSLMTRLGYKTLVVVNKKNILLGVISDGDLRKSLLKGFGFNETLEKIYNKNSKFIYDTHSNPENIKKTLLKYQIDLVPIVDHLKYFIRCETIYELFKSKKNKKINYPVLIMAGGKGTRMLPYTNFLPKPLMPFKNKTLIDHIIEGFYVNKINKFYISLFFKSILFKTYIKESYFINKITFIEERKSLGTAGSIKRMQKFNHSDFFVINCDVIFNTDFYEIFKFHFDNKNDLTVVTVNKDFQIRYGACKTDKKNNLLSIIEKPLNSYEINSGLYVVNKKICNLIKANDYMDMDNLIKKAILKNYKVKTFSISENNWTDVGQIKDYLENIN